MPGKYLVIEGQDATGKTTQVEMLAELLKSRGHKVAVFNEPDGDLEVAHQIRKILKNKDFNLDPITNVLLFTAARNELWHKIAEPILAEDGFVVASRNWWSTLAYQSYGEDVPFDQIKEITESLLPERYCHPDKAVILTLDEEQRLVRQSSRDNNSVQDAFESRNDTFQNKVNNGYLDIAKKFQIPTVDTTPSPQEIFETVTKIFEL